MRRSFRVTADPFASRLAIVVTAIFFLLSLMTIRLFVRSVISHEANRAKAEQQYLVRQNIEPRRGTIYALDAEAALASPHDEKLAWKPVATNERTYALSVVPRNIKDKREAAKELAPWAEMSEDDLFAKIDNNKPYLPPLRRGLSERDKDAITELHIQGVFLSEEADRLYPEGSLLSQVLGFVNTEKEGNYGLEQKYDEDLRGSGGQVLAERDVRGRILGAESEQPVRDGSHLVLTIDRNVQGFVERTLKKALETYQADSGTIVVLDVKTGGVVAMASAPDFNPNEYSDAEIKNFVNPGVNAVWEPGSIFKTIVMAAGLHHGVIEPETEGVFGSSVRVQGYDIHTAENKAYGRETMTQVLENSDNVGMVWVAEKIGTDKLAQTLEDFGFGQPLGIDLPGEIGGYMLSGSKWQEINRATISFGQGISTTPLQIASAMATIANGGTQMQPHIVSKIIGADGTIINEFTPRARKENVISPSAAAKATAMMVSVVENGHGKRAKVPGYAVAGKTGTAEIARPREEGGGYYEGEHIGGFGGFFPADNPRFAMVVKLDRPKTVKFAESSAAPTFGEVAQFMVNYYRIPPTEPIQKKE